MKLEKYIQINVNYLIYFSGYAVSFILWGIWWKKIDRGWAFGSVLDVLFMSLFSWFGVGMIIILFAVNYTINKFKKDGNK